jgi:GABA permease
MRRYLVVANQTLGASALYEKVKECLALEPCSFFIVVPATPPVGTSTWTEEEAWALALDRLERAMAWFEELGAEVDGQVGDANAMLAIWDALREREFDQIILSTLPPGISRWLKMDLPSRIQAAYSLPVIHIISAPETSRVTRHG